jgi:hypothetical protein
VVSYVGGNLLVFVMQTEDDFMKAMLQFVDSPHIHQTMGQNGIDHVKVGRINR